MGETDTTIILNGDRGGSGAIVQLYAKNCVRKIGSTRVGLEGMWLHDNRAPGIVNVSRVWDTGYDMELLEKHPGFAGAFDYVSSVASLLAFDVWSRPAVQLKMDHDAHRVRLQPLLPHLNKHALVFTQLYYSIPWQNLIIVKTHGDPIADNIMRRGNEDVLIDPIPSTAAIPDYLAVDIGRIIQSAIGYESARYQLAGFESCERIDHVIEMCYKVMNRRLHRYEIMACYYFAAFHLMRAMADRRSTPAICARLQPLLDRVMKEGEVWMSSSLPEDVAVD